MSYKLLYTSWYGGQRKVVVFDFKKGATIEFTMDELDKNELDKSLINYIYKIRKTIESGYWDYQN